MLTNNSTKKLLRLGLVGSALVTALSVGLGGAAFASAGNTGQGSWQGRGANYSTQRSEPKAYWDGQKWGNYDPQMWRDRGDSFDKWWGSLMQEVSHYQSTNWQRCGSQNKDWQNDGNWQAKWPNWDPQMWQQNDQTYGHWYAQMMSYLNSNRGNWQKNWGGKKASYDKHDQKDNQYDNNHDSDCDNRGPTTVRYIQASAPVHRQYTTYQNNWGNTSTRVSNVFSVNNSNSQSVRSGNASSYGNTYSGSVRSGDATAYNSTSFASFGFNVRNN